MIDAGQTPLTNYEAIHVFVSHLWQVDWASETVKSLLVGVVGLDPAMASMLESKLEEVGGGTPTDQVNHSGCSGCSLKGPP